MEIYEKLALKMKEKGHNQMTLHDASGVAQGTISAFLLGKSDLRVSTLIRLAHVLETPPAWFVTEDEDPAPDDIVSGDPRNEAARLCMQLTADEAADVKNFICFKLGRRR